MSGLRFKVGEIAIYAVARDSHGIRRVGTQCEVLAVGPFREGQYLTGPNGVPGLIVADGDYFVAYADGFCAVPRDWQLRKIDPPAEPESLIHREEVEA